MPGTVASKLSARLGTPDVKETRIRSLHYIQMALCGPLKELNTVQCSIISTNGSIVCLEDAS